MSGMPRLVVAAPSSGHGKTAPSDCWPRYASRGCGPPASRSGRTTWTPATWVSVVEGTMGLLDAAGAPGEQLALGYREATARSVSPFLRVGTEVVVDRRHRGLVTPRAGEQP
ncbi:MAG: hypothetical protein V7603_2252, partial [Micromonosporaceae bacterium]